MNPSLQENNPFYTLLCLLEEGHSMSIQPMILGHVLKFTYNLPYLFAIKDYRLSQFFVYSMLFVFKLQGSEYLIFWWPFRVCCAIAWPSSGALFTYCFLYKGTYEEFIAMALTNYRIEKDKCKIHYSCWFVHCVMGPLAFLTKLSQNVLTTVYN